MAGRYALQPADAEDAVQEAMLRAWQRRDALRDRHAASAWLMAIVRNEALRTRTRRQGMTVPCAELEEAPTATDEAAVADDRLDVAESLRRLGARDRELVLLRYWGGLSNADIAARMGMTETTVRVRLHRARCRLAK